MADTFKLVLQDGTVVGGADTADNAVTLAAGLYSFGAADVSVRDASDTPIAWVGNSPDYAPPEQPLAITAEGDPENPTLFTFTVANAEADTDLDFGDGGRAQLPTGETEIEHDYEAQGTYRVVAVSGGQQADVYVTAGTPPEMPLQILSLEPSSAEVGGEDVTLHVNGSGFEPGATIVFNEGDEQTVFISAEELTTLVKPSTASGAVTVPVKVRNPDGGLTDSLDFSFTEPDEE
jgi:hypothetical protein